MARGFCRCAQHRDVLEGWRKHEVPVQIGCCHRNRGAWRRSRRMGAGLRPLLHLSGVQRPHGDARLPDGDVCSFDSGAVAVSWCVSADFPPRPDKVPGPRYPEESDLALAPFSLQRQACGRPRLAAKRASKHFDHRIRYAIYLLVCHFRIKWQRQHFVSRAFGHRQLSGLSTERSIGRLKMQRERIENRRGDLS